MTRNEYYTQVTKVEEAAEKQFTESKEGKELYKAGCDSREWRDALRQARLEAINRWAAEQPEYFSITIDREGRSTEIKDCYLGSSITVYQPERDYFFEANGKGVRIKPAYMNASTWDTRGDVKLCQWRTKNYLKMVEIAFDLQNELNQVLVDWQTMENPFDNARWEKQELKRLREQIKRHNDEAQSKAAARKERRGRK